MTNSANDHKQTLMKVIKKRKIVIPSLIVILVGAMLITLGMVKNNKLELTIGDEVVPKEAFIHAMSNEKYDVTQYFYKEYGAEVDGGFWERSYDGEVPYEMLADETLDTLSYEHAIYELAKERGYLTAIGYDNLLKRFERENNDRAKKVQNGEPVYGLAEFSLDLFIEYEMNTLEKMYTNDLENEGMNISKEAGKKYYDENKDKLFVKNDDIEIEFIKIYYASLELKENEVNKLESDLKSLFKELTKETETTLESLIGDHESLEPYYQSTQVLSEEYSARAQEMGDVLELSADLDSGESTQVINQNGSLYLIRCIDREKHDYLSYDLVEDNILKKLRERNYGSMIADRAKDISVNGDMQRVYAFTKEQLKQ